MKVLVLNCGSSSLKYQLVDMESEKVITKGTYERIGQNNSFVTIKQNGEKIPVDHPVENHEQALKFVIYDLLIGEKYGVIKDLKEIDAVGHRVSIFRVCKGKRGVAVVGRNAFLSSRFIACKDRNSSYLTSCT